MQPKELLKAIKSVIEKKPNEFESLPRLLRHNTAAGKRTRRSLTQFGQPGLNNRAAWVLSGLKDF